MGGGRSGDRGLNLIFRINFPPLQGNLVPVNTSICVLTLLRLGFWTLGLIICNGQRQLRHNCSGGFEDNVS